MLPGAGGSMRRAVVVLAIVVCGCGSSPDARPSPLPTAPAAPAPATSWIVSGKVLVAPAGAPISNASIAFGDLSVTSDANGNYSLVTADAVERPISISAPGYFTRETSLAGGVVRTGVTFDLIGEEPAFPR